MKPSMAMILTLLLLVTVSQSTPQVTLPEQNGAGENLPQGPEGNWELVWHGYPEAGQTTRARAVLKRTWEQVCMEVAAGGCRYENKMADSAWHLEYSISPYEQSGGDRQDGVASNGRLNIQWGHETLGHWGGRSELQQVGPHELRGRWSYGDNGGAEVWQRAVPRVTHVVFQSPDGYQSSTNGGGPAKVRLDWWGESGDNREVRNGFGIEIYGEKLWGHHLINFGDAVDLEFSRELAGNMFQLENGEISSYQSLRAFSERSGLFANVVGIAGYINLRQFATPGLKTIYVDGRPFPFELVLNGYSQSPTNSEKRPVKSASAYGAAAGALP